jgi:hypothetical protein
MADTGVVSRLSALEKQVHNMSESIDRLEGAVIAREGGFERIGELAEHVKQLAGVIDNWRSQAQGRGDDDDTETAVELLAAAQLDRIANALESRTNGRDGVVLTDDDPRRVEVWENVSRLSRILDRPEDRGIARNRVRTVPFDPRLRSHDPIEPLVVWPGGDVSFYGQDLHAVSEVIVDGTPAELVRVAPDEVRFVVPEDATDGQVDLYLEGGAKWQGFELDIRTADDFEEANI